MVDHQLMLNCLLQKRAFTCATWLPQVSAASGTEVLFAMFLAMSAFVILDEGDSGARPPYFRVALRLLGLVVFMLTVSQLKFEVWFQEQLQAED